MPQAYNLNRVTLEVTTGPKPDGDDWIIVKNADEIFPVFDRIDRLYQKGYSITHGKGCFRLVNRKGGVVMTAGSFRGLAVDIVLSGL